MPVKVGLAIFTDAEDEWVIALTDSDYLTGSTRLYKIYARRNQVWCRKDWEVAGLLSAPRFRGVLHIGTLNVELPTLHGRMQSVCSSEGRGQPNPTDLPWGRKPWIVRVLLTFQSEYGLPIPRINQTEMPLYIETRIHMLIPSMPLLPMIPYAT
ncbi:hypothetical protein CVT24_003162 [Panaeolus cyanescens]|uniref:Uncharacterized protein n=1 Tax=Panaeolus cyanescens TaxID=181874 RepID=A0A409VP20_9AGAR|nr:hypothetical protein CVT24_003162 [Panaeolus cyanescens]